MSPAIRIILIVVSLLVFLLMMRRIRREKFLISDAVFWILFCAGLLVLSIFPQIAIFFADLLDFYSPANLVYVLIIFVLLMKMFFMALKSSNNECKLRQTAQTVAILEKRLRELEARIPESGEDDSTRQEDTK